MKWYQHLLKYPFRHIGALAASSSLIGLMIAFLVPSQFEAIQAEFFFSLLHVQHDHMPDHDPCDHLGHHVFKGL